MSEEKQIDEMAKAIAKADDTCRASTIAAALYRKGCRMQTEGEWIYGEHHMAHCSVCGNEEPEHALSPYCPECGAHMESEEVIE